MRACSLLPVMGGKKLQSSGRAGVWSLVERQHGVIARRQLLDLGFSRHAIEHRLNTGRLIRSVLGSMP